MRFEKIPSLLADAIVYFSARRGCGRALGLLGGLLCFGAVGAHGATLTELHAFPLNNGGSPYSSLMQASDGNFYGTTFGSGPHSFGTVFKLTTNGILTTLVSFTGFQGANPYGGLMQASNGMLYGTTQNGGPSGPDGDGSVFQLTTNGNLTTLFFFPGGTNGANPMGPLLQGSDGNLYGVTAYGGMFGGGTVYEITTNGTVTIVGSLRLNYAPKGNLVQGSDGSFYGTPTGFGSGSIFKVKAGSAVSYLFPTTGTSFDGLIMGIDGFLYGTSSTPPGLSNGDVFKVSAIVSSITTYPFNGTNGAKPYGGLVQDVDGNFYGTTSIGGTNGGFGTVFKMATNGTLTSLFSFNGTNGAKPYARLIKGSDGNFYGTTQGGGLYNAGTVFSITTNGTLSTLVSFGGEADPSSLIQSADGNLYGTTCGKGAQGLGSVFRLSPDGAYSTLHDFAAGEGFNPYAALALGSDGRFYGSAETGPVSPIGAIFTITTNGDFTNLFTFNLSNGQQPFASLLESGGFFYGTTRAGSPNGRGVIFRVSTNGVLADSFAFGGYNGANPTGSLTLGSDGSFYGTTEYGGVGYDGATLGNGVLFRFSGFGATPTNLVYFNGTNGANPYAGLTPGSDGNLYGTTISGGTYNLGTVYQITTNGTFNSLFSFDATNGAHPFAGLIQGGDGDFYGTTYLGGDYNYGTIFRIATNGTLTRIYSFGTVQDSSGNGLDGAYPGTSLLQTANGDFYGTASAGGTQNGGNIFRFSLRPMIQFGPQTGGAVSLAWNTTPGLTYQLQSSPDLNPGNWSNLGSSIPATNSSVTVSYPPTIGDARFYRVLLLP
ncbi:MAG: 3-carboxymuconate cyclase [Pedosphaera sp.]|nr:3-carboxymuconate cyclase [Pedosphaera sp.]